MDYMYKPVTVKWLRVEEGGAAFDVGGTELHFKQRAGQIGTEDWQWCHLLGSARSWCWSSPEGVHLQAPNEYFLQTASEADSYSAAEGISRHSCTCGSPQLVLFLSQLKPGHVPTNLFNIIFSSRRTSPPLWLAIGFVFRRSQVEMSAQWLFFVFSSLRKMQDRILNQATTTSCHILYSSVFIDNSAFDGIFYDLLTVFK